LGVLELCFGGDKPTKAPPVATGLIVTLPGAVYTGRETPRFVGMLLLDSSWKHNHQRPIPTREYSITLSSVDPYVQKPAIFCECKGYFAQKSLNLPAKLLCDKLSPYEFSKGVVTLYFCLPSFHRLK